MGCKDDLLFEEPSPQENLVTNCIYQDCITGKNPLVSGTEDFRKSAILLEGLQRAFDAEFSDARDEYLDDLVYEDEELVGLNSVGDTILYQESWRPISIYINPNFSMEYVICTSAICLLDFICCPPLRPNPLHPPQRRCDQ